MSKHNRGVKPKLKQDSDALTKEPPAPKHLSKYAVAEWKRVMPQLIERQIITRADLARVENYCSMIGAVKHIETDQTASGVLDPK